MTETTNKRPILISIISVLQIISGSLLLILSIILAIAYRITEFNLMLPVNITTSIVIGLIFASGINLASGIGLWKGKKWGWWLGCFYMAYKTANNANLIWVMYGMTDILSQTKITVSAVRYGMSCILYGLLVYYFFRPNVLNYFGLGRTKKFPLLASVIGTVLLLFIILKVIYALTYSGI